MLWKRGLSTLVVMITAIAAGLGIATRIAQSQSPVEKEILKLENDWSTGWQKKDAAFLQKLWADEYINTDQDGATYTKAQDLANVSSPGTSVTSFALADMRVHVYGETAVVTGVNTIKATQNGKDISGAYRFTDVFVKRDGRWQVVATQGSLVAKKK